MRIHALTARAVRATATDPTAVAHTVAEALLQLWPDNDHTGPTVGRRATRQHHHPGRHRRRPALGPFWTHVAPYGEVKLDMISRLALSVAAPR